MLFRSNRAGSGHGGATGHADEAAFGDGRVAQALGAVLGEEAGGGAEVAAADADAFAAALELKTKL